MTFTPSNLKRWTRPDSYAGAEWPAYFSSGVGRSRDVARLDDNWRFDRPAAAERAMQLDMIAFMRRKYRILSTALIQNLREL